MGGKGGRPVEPVPQDKADAICAWISEGGTLREWCRENKIAWGTIYLWMAKDAEFAERIAHARNLGYDAIAEDVLRIADTQLEGVTTKTTERGKEETREDMLGHRKLQIETRLKLLAKWNPKKYGDKIETTHAGTVEFKEIQRVIVDPK